MDINYANKMISALIAHVDYLKSSRRYKTTITNGKLESQAGSRYIYKFDNEFASDISSDGEINIEIDEVRLPAIIVSLEGKSIKLSLQSDRGQEINRAEIISNKYLLQEKLKERLMASKNNPKAGSGLGNMLLEPDRHDPADDQGKALVKTNWDQNLNQQQHAALDSALRNKISYIWGPPGTGKTKVIASIIDSYIQNDLSVLLLSNTNIATDEALYKTAEHFKQTSNPILENGKIVRIGHIRHKQLEEEYGQYVSRDSIAEREKTILQNKIGNCEQQLDQCRQAEQKINQSLASLKNYRQLQAGIQAGREKMSNGDFQCQEIIKSLEQEDNELKWAEYNNRKRLKQVLSLDTETRFRANKIRLQEDQADLQGNMEFWEAQAAKNRQELQDLEQKAREIGTALGNVSENSLSKDLERATGSVNKLNKQIGYLQSSAKRVDSKIIQEAKLVAATLANSYLHNAVLERKYDCIIIDEISMASPPAVWHAANMAQRRVVVVGDFMQLPPIADYRINKNSQSPEQDKINERLIDRWLRKDIFELSGLQATIEDGRKTLPANLVVLRGQYRMQKPIVDLVNHLVYGRYRNGQFALQTPPTKTSDRSQLLSGFNLTACDTSNQRPYVSLTANGSRYCVLHAVLVSTLAQLAINKGYEKIGIVTAYRAQATLIQMIIKDKQLDQQVEANTVHSFQGGEKPLMIFDITTPLSSSMYDNSHGNGPEKILNVAISRAREECVIVGDIQNILKHHSKTSPVRSMLNHLRGQRLPFHPLEYFSDTATQARGINQTVDKITTMTDPTGLHIFSEKDFYESFKHDIKEAEKEIIIVSPFMTVDRTNDLLNILDAARRRSINIFVITRDPRKQDETMSAQADRAMRSLEAQGIIVLPMNEEIHQKLAFIDRRVFWSGSLNILSHRSAKENMFRQDPAENTIIQLLENLKLDKNIGRMGENKIRKCEYCNHYGARYWKEGRQIYCLRCNRKLSGN